MSICTPLGRAILAGLLTGLLLPTIALAHAELDKATPADKSTVQGSPTEILMTFTEAVDPAKSSIKLVDASGAVVADGSTVSSGNPKLMRLAIDTVLAPATYTVRWTTASAVDGDVARGTTTFTVAAGSSVAPSATPAPSAPAASSAAASVAPSEAPSSAPSVAPSPSSPPTTPATSTNDAVIPIIVALVVLVGLGAWLLRSRAGAR